MATLFNRLGWLFAFTFGLIVGFIISDLFSGSYSSGADNFFEWGWMWSIVFMIFAKKFFFSEAMIREELSRSDIILPPREAIEHPLSSTAGIGSTEHKENNLEDANVSDHVIGLDVGGSDVLIEKTESPSAPEKPNWLVTFFSDRPLAKIGGILLFLGALFFLSLVWSAVGSVGKILIGLIFGFFLYGIGVWMDKKGHIAESRTLLGVGIAINTLTILSGRWIIGSGTDMVLSDTVTLVFLLLNTLFAVVTGLVYTSRTFLIFSFIFAYLIPFLIGSQSESEMLMILYVGLISGGGYLLTYLLGSRSMASDTRWLFYTINVGSLILMILSGFSLDTLPALIVFLVISALLTWVATYLSDKIGDTSSLGGVLIAGYIMLASGLFGMGEQEGILIIQIIGLFPLVLLTGMQIVAVGSSMMLSAILLIPLLFGLFFLGIFGIGSIMGILFSIVGLYVLISIFLFSYLVRVVQYLIFIGLALFLGICGFMIDITAIDLIDSERLIVSSAAIIFFLLSLYTTLRHRVSHIALIGVIASSMILGIVLSPGLSYSWLFFLMFLIVGFFFPFVMHMMRVSFSPASLISYQVVLNIFMIGELVYLGKNIWFTDSSASLVTLGLIVFTVSIASLVYSWTLVRVSLMSESLSLSSLSAEKKMSASALFAIPLSLFSLAVGITFSESALIVSTVWILESSILAYFSGKSKNHHILTGSIILLIIGLLRLIPFFDTIHPRAWFALIPLSVIAVSLSIGVRSIVRGLSGEAFYDILHVIGIGTVGLAYMEIIPHTQTGWSLFGVSIFLALSVWVYRGVSSAIIAFWLTCISIGYFLLHLGRFGILSLSPFPVLVQLSALALSLYATWHIVRQSRVGSILAFVFGSSMTLLITSLYINEITNNVFVVTIYLTLLATLFIIRGISTEKSYFRTVGLYIGAIALVKILFYDLWVGVDNLIIRVLALMISGGVMIALSQLYGRRVDRSWSAEFSWDNFTILPIQSPSTGTMLMDDTIPFDEEIAPDLSKFDISHIAQVRLRDISGAIRFESKRAGIIRTVYSITTSLKKTEFAPAELEKIYMTLLPHIRSSLPKKELDTILSTISGWIADGGSVEIVHRNIK